MFLYSSFIGLSTYIEDVKLKLITKTYLLYWKFQRKMSKRL